ncbi:coiled-coil domain-containing protein 89 isoform X2 [Cynoglossus semilaevis]|nr:coiled-coil domain-containing protein 89 isoform X2 [Cynoglossus semilaevis]
MDNIQRSTERLLNLSGEGVSETLRSRIDEQSSLISILKKKSDELLHRCQALENVNTTLEEKITNYQEELEAKSRKEKLLEKRFTELATNTQSIISFMNEYKNENATLKAENKQLQLENNTLFSQKLQDKEGVVQQLKQEIKLVTEDSTVREKVFKEKLAEYQSKLDETTQQQVMEVSLLHQLHDAQQQQNEAVETSKGLKLELERAEEKFALKEMDLRKTIAGLAEEKSKILSLSMERARVIQVKQEELQHLKKRWKEERKTIIQADESVRLAEASNTAVAVKNLQRSLSETTLKYERLKKDFEAFKEHSCRLLTQERELNKKLRQITG